MNKMLLPASNELEYFLEVCNVLNLSRAAERLGISQPSLSLAVKRLEETVGTPLFVRHKHGMTLTQAGKQLLVHTRQLMQYWEKTKSQVLAASNLVQGTFKLGCPSTIAMHLFSAVLPALLRQHPNLELHLKHDISRKITEEVINLSLDIGIVVNPVKHPDLIIRKLCQDEETLWISDKKHAIQDIHSNEAVLLCNPEITQTQLILNKCKKAGIYFKRIITMNSFEVVANLTANGCGVAILPERVAKSMYPAQLKRIPKAPFCVDDICVIYRNENREVEAVRAIIAAIFKVYS